MCCITRVEGLPPFDILLTMLQVGGFERQYRDNDNYWQREFTPKQILTIEASDETPLVVVNRKITVSVTQATNEMTFSLVPSISNHTEEHHRMAGIMPCVVNQLCAVIGEKANSTIFQMSLRGDCQDEGHARLLGAYPEFPIQFENMCLGFRTVLEHGVMQEWDEEPIPRREI